MKKTQKSVFVVANICFCHKSLFFRVAEVCFCLFFKEKMVRIWSVFSKIRSALNIGDTGDINIFGVLCLIYPNVYQSRYEKARMKFAIMPPFTTPS